MLNKKSCNKECNGIIRNLKVLGLNSSTQIIVEYVVDGKSYFLKENLAMKKDKTYFFGFIPIGYTTKSLIEAKTGIKAIVGNSVRVKYDESNPNNSYLIDNVAKISWD